MLAGYPLQAARNFLCRSQRPVLGRGFWEGAAGRWRINYTEEEFCHLLSGTVVLTDDVGASRRFEAGASFVIPAGFTGAWENLSLFRPSCM